MSVRDASARESAMHTRRGEPLVAALAIACFLAVEIWLCGGAILFTRPLWLDEIHTLLVAGRQDMETSMRGLAAGTDFNPPTLYVLYRGVAQLSGGLSEPVLRMVGVASVVGAICVVYWVLRVQFDRWASGVGALAVWAQSIVVAEAFDARFYGPWLFGAAVLSLAVQRRTGRPTWMNAVGLATASVFLCTIHYFGVLSWLSGVLVALWFGRRAVVRTAVQLIPGLAGPVALALCAPFYVGQRAALSTATWIPDLSAGSVLFLVGLALLTPPVLVAAIGWAATRVLQRGSKPTELQSDGPSLTLGPALLVGQALVPVTLAVFSLVVQPAMQPRYSIAAALVAAPVVALAYTRSLPLFRVVTLVAIIASSGALVLDARKTARSRAALVHDDLEQVARIAASDTGVVVRRRHSLYPLVVDRPALARHLVLLDGTSLAPNDRFELVERDVARVHRRQYGFPQIVSRTDLDSASTFYFLEQESTRAPTPAEFPDRRIERVGPRLFRLETTSRNGSSVLYRTGASPPAERVAQ
jgi:hypothetical protein